MSVVPTPYLSKEFLYYKFYTISESNESSIQAVSGHALKKNF